ncbi:MAG: DUF4349 domain-containing protein, partial [Chloroflexota bacterium]
MAGAPAGEQAGRRQPAAAGQAASAASRDASKDAPATMRPGVAPAASDSANAAPGQQVVPPLPAADRMIVKTGALTLQVTDLVEAVQRVGGVVASIPGAYVAASSTSYRAEPEGVASARAVSAAQPAADPALILPPRPVPAPGQSASVTIKVPAGDFDQVLERLRELGTPLREHVSTQEVTEEYVDLEAQVRNLEATE